MNICPFLCPLSKASLNRTTAKYEELGIKCLLFRLQWCPKRAGQFSKCRGRCWDRSLSQLLISIKSTRPPHPLLLPSSHSRGDEWRDDGAVAEMTGTQLLITCLLLNTLNSHFPTVLRSPCPHIRFSAAESSTQQLMGPNKHLALAPSYLPAPALTSRQGIKTIIFFLQFTLD